ncbi:hypothetical protein [Chryseobacterium sp. S90]|uniref:hypothetical protein n=1 Tax=Chryseobacterium sp. S90 TaxID=3395373 RepID=UPI0039BC531E
MLDLAIKIDKIGFDLTLLNSYFKKGDDYLYNSFQRTIADFIIENNFFLKTCHYCNINYINVFNQFIIYETLEDFFHSATEQEWKKLLGKKTGLKIYDFIYKNPNCKTDELIKIKGVTINTISKINLKEINKLETSKNHFTLDHVLSKKNHVYLSLSIYNLVPSCSPCNSKFKGEKDFVDLKFINSISPSSEDFKLDEYLNFKLNLKKDISNINHLEDIEVKIKNINRHTDIDNFIEMFQLKGRYEWHKDIASDLIQKRKKYSNSQIEEILKLFKRNHIPINRGMFMRHIFGDNIFEKELTYEPFEKYKKDIAKQLRII